MPLLDAILAANHRLGTDHKAPLLDTQQSRDSLPLAALTCIDARLNHLFPDVLGIPESEFIWLRNSGNIIFGTTSAMMRSLALACAIKGAREIAVIGHTDCLVCKSTVLSLTDRFKALGVERSKLPDDLVDFFGLFASERQNVMKACDTIRNSPLIGPKIPIHGLLVDTHTGRLERIVNGYESLVAVAAPVPAADTNAPAGSTASGPAGMSGLAPLTPMPSFEIGAIKFPESKIGELAGDVQRTSVAAKELLTDLKHREFRPAWESAKALAAEVKETVRDAREAASQARQTARDLKSMSPAERVALLARRVDRAVRYRVIGADQKQYGPISGAKLLEWLADDRIGADTAIQVEGTKLWQRLGQLAESRTSKPPPIGDTEQRTKRQ